MTKKDFCKFFTEYYGEPLNDVNQVKCSFEGIELYDFVNAALRQPTVIKSVCPRCSSNEDIRVKPITNDCMECGHTWQTVL